MIIQTTRFGQVQIEDQDVLPFPEGILGFADLKNFVLLDDPSDDIFAWLQSCDEPAIAFPVLEPELFADQYKVTLTRTDMESIQLQSMNDAKMFCIVTIPEAAAQMTANLKAPKSLQFTKSVSTTTQSKSECTEMYKGVNTKNNTKDQTAD